MDDHGCSEANPCRNAALRWVHTSYCQILTLSADRKALRDHVRKLEAQGRALADIAMQTKAQWDSQIAMTVARLGGEVEGAPTHAGNFLQRIDALRKVERAALAPRSERREGEHKDCPVCGPVTPGDWPEIHAGPLGAGQSAPAAPKAPERGACDAVDDLFDALADDDLPDEDGK